MDLIFTLPFFAFCVFMYKCKTPWGFKKKNAFKLRTESNFCLGDVEPMIKKQTPRETISENPICLIIQQQYPILIAGLGCYIGTKAIRR